MTTRWKMLGLSTLLAAAVAVAPARAEDSDTGKLTDSQKLDLLLQQCKDMQRSLATLDSLKDDLKSLRAKTEVLQDRMEGLHGRLNSMTTANKDVFGEFHERIRKLEADLDALHKQLDGQTRISGYGPTAPPPAPPPPGTIRLRNTYPGMVTIVVNGTTYRLASGETRDLPGQPAGTFTYEVLGMQPLKAVTLGPKEAFTIDVFAR
jgi:hypothetical protein